MNHKSFIKLNQQILIYKKTVHRYAGALETITGITNLHPSDIQYKP